MKDTIKLIAYCTAFVALIAGFTTKKNNQSATFLLPQMFTQTPANLKPEPKQVTPICPSSRTEIKTLTDTGSANIKISLLSVQDILKFKKPPYDSKSPRTNHEFYKCKLNCYIKSYTETEYGYKLKIQGFDDTTALMYANIINPDCEQAQKSIYLPDFKLAYTSFKDYVAAKKLNRGCYKIIGTLLYEENEISIFPIIQITKFK